MNATAVRARSARAIEALPARKRVLAELPTWPKGRRCSDPYCTTVLSIYNPGPACHLHTRTPDPEELPLHLQDAALELAALS